MIFPATICFALLEAAVAMVASILFLRTRNFFYDSLALAATEIGLVILGLGIVAGTIGAHTTEMWWTWDSRLTAALVCWLLYAPYLMLRNAVEEPTRRAASAAAVSIFAFFDIPVIVLAVDWWLRGHGTAFRMTPEWWVFAVLIIVGGVLTMTRLRKEQQRRAQDAERRESQTI